MNTRFIYPLSKIEISRTGRATLDLGRVKYNYTDKVRVGGYRKTPMSSGDYSEYVPATIVSMCRKETVAWRQIDFKLDL